MHTLLYFIFVQVTLLIPGYVALSRTRLLVDKPGVKLCAAYMTSVAFFALSALASYILDIPHITIQVIGWLVIGVSCVLFIWDKLYVELWKLRFPLGAFVVMSLFVMIFISMPLSGTRPFIPDPNPVAGSNYDALNVKVLNVAQTNANDNYIPYRQAQFIVNRSDPGKDDFIDEWGVHFFQRTPLMGAVAAQYFILLNNKPPIGYTWANDGRDPSHTYLKFQIIAETLNCLFVVPAFFLLTRFFNKRTAQITLLFIIPNQYFLFDAFFTWPKSLVAFFVLFSWLLLLEKQRRYLVLAGVASGMAYLTHDLGVLYIGASCIFLMVHKRWRDTILFAGISALFAIPWLLTAAVKYKKPSTFIYYPISTQGIPQIAQRKQIIHDFLHTSPFKLIGIRLNTLFYQLTPYQLMFSEGGQVIGRRLWAFGLFSIPGAVGVGLIVPTVIGFCKKLASKDVWILIFAPVVLCCLIIGWPKGLGAIHFAEASVVLLMGIGCAFLLRLKNRMWLQLCFALNALQSVYFTFYSYNFHLSAWITRPKALVGTLCLCAIVGGCALCVRRIGRQSFASRTA